MARKQLWMVTVEQNGGVVGWTEKNYTAAEKEVLKMKDLPDATGADFRIFRLTLVNGKLYANRIVGKDPHDTKDLSKFTLADVGTSANCTGTTIPGSSGGPEGLRPGGL